MSKASKIFVVLVCVLFVSFMAESSAGESLSRSITVGDNQLLFIPQPQSGYVIQSQEGVNSTAFFGEALRLSDDVEIKQVGGLQRQGVSIIFNERPAGENEKTIESLRYRSQAKYAASLFSLNGQTVAVIPEIVVRLTAEADIEEFEAMCRVHGMSVKKKMEFTDDEYLLDVSGDNADSVFAAVDQLGQSSMVKWAGPNIAFQPLLSGQMIPNDEYFSKLWHLHNTGQTGGTQNADVDAPEAWEITAGNPDIIVAILDTGVDMNHPDLINNIVPGYDFIEDDAVPEPGRFWADDAHGTNCAGLVAAQGNNGIGVAGIAWNCRIMPIRILSEESYTTEADIATAFRWAAENGADILSNSWGYLYSSQTIYSAISDVTAPGGIGRDGKGCLVFCASGNWEDGGEVVYPALYPDVIAVGAIDHYGEVWYYSGGGEELDLVAPSGGVQRTDYFMLGKPYQFTTDITGISGYSMYNLDIDILDYSDTMGGTSGACPIAAGVGALVLSIDPSLTNLQARRVLINSAVDLGDPGFDESYGYGCVNAFAAVDMTINPPPAPPSESVTLYVDDDAADDIGPDDSNTSDPLEDGTVEHPFDSIQEAVDYAEYAETIVVMAGTYSGIGNYDIDFSGKAVKIRGAGPDETIIDCQDLGRGFYFHSREDSDSVLDGLTVTNGRAYYGGAVYCTSGSSPAISNCVFKENWVVSWGSTGGMGGAVCVRDSSNPTFTNCTFQGNMAVWYGAGIYSNSSNPVVTDCTFNENMCGYGGGGVYNYSGSPKLNDCIFNGNSAQTRGGAIYDYEGAMTLENCTFNGNTAINWDGGGIFSQYSALVMAYCQFIGNVAGDWGGAVCLSECSLTLNNCDLVNNTTGTAGGGFYLDWSEVTLTNCVIAGNTVAGAGGGVYSDGSTSELTNCTFASNSAEYGDSFACDTWWLPSTIQLRNCILWDSLDGIWNNDGSILNVNYSNMMVAGESWDGIGNINTDPLFADAAGGDYHLQSETGRWDPNTQGWIQDNVTSPCIDAGDPSDSVGSEPQPNGGVINMGAYGGTSEASMSQ